MEQVFNDNGDALDINKIEFLSSQGSEFIVYKYFNSVLKLYKSDYKLSHLSLEELNVLKAISTKRILLPTGTLWNTNHKLVGYEMPFIAGEKNIDIERTTVFFEELRILQQDLNLLCDNFIIMQDVNLSNTIYNGKIYLVDPGNYLVNELDKIIFHSNITNSEISEKLKKMILEDDYSKINILIDSLSLEERQRLIMEWNYNKINGLIHMLLFSKKNYIDFFRFRQIVYFFKSVKEEKGLVYDLDVLEMYFNPNLNIKDATIDFVKKYIKDTPEERKLILSLYGK